MDINKQLNKAIIDSDIEKAESLLEEELEKDKDNIDLLLRLVSTVTAIPLLDVDKGLKYLEAIQKIEKNNIDAKLLECCIYHYNLGGVDNRLYSDLCSLQSDDKKILAMIEYIKSWHFFKNDEARLNVLKASVKLDDRQVWNNVKLGKLLIKMGETGKGIAALYKGLNNIEHVFSNEDVCDFTDYKIFLKEHIEGTVITVLNLQSIVENICKHEFNWQPRV